MTWVDLRDLNRRLGFPTFYWRWLRLRGFYRHSEKALACVPARGLTSPLLSALRLLELTGHLPERLIALEVFGGVGFNKTIDLARRVEHMTHLEISECISHYARKTLPKDKMAFLCVDSIEAIRIRDFPRDDYNLVHADNPCCEFGPYCENFDLFPDLFLCLKSQGVVIFNVQPDIRPNNPGESWLRRRREFFDLGEEADPRLIPYATMEKQYLDRVPKDQFTVEATFAVPHAGRQTVSLVICLKGHDG